MSKFMVSRFHKIGLLCFSFVGLFLLTGDVFAASDLSLGKVAENITESFEGVAKLITAGSYIAGLGFSIGAIMKFKQHKDNPTQIPIGTPIALLFIAAALLFLPSILSVVGTSMFSGDQKTAGYEGKKNIFE